MARQAASPTRIRSDAEKTPTRSWAETPSGSPSFRSYTPLSPSGKPPPRSLSPQEQQPFGEATSVDVNAIRSTGEIMREKANWRAALLASDATAGNPGNPFAGNAHGKQLNMTVHTQSSALGGSMLVGGQQESPELRDSLLTSTKAKARAC